MSRGNRATGGGGSRGDRLRIAEHEFELLLTPEEIAREVDRVAAEIVADLREGTPQPLFLCVLKGAVLFCADLLRAVNRPVILDFIGIASYGARMSPGPSLTFTSLPGTEIRGRNVIVVEDIVDSGRTLAALREYLHEAGAASVRVASFLYKPTGRNQGGAPEYVGVEIEDRFVVGYGLDYAEEGRELPGIYALCGGEAATPEEPPDSPTRP